jgi:hypothetical protein
MSLSKFKRPDNYPKHPILEALHRNYPGMFPDRDNLKSTAVKAKTDEPKYTGYPYALMLKGRHEMNNRKRRYERFKSKYAPFIIGILLGIIIGLLWKY